MTEDIKLTFLGTGDSIPSKSRNHTSIFLGFKGENILFDCGEGTQRQLRKANLNPCKITRILISHWHGDHVLGLPGLLSTLAMSGYKKTLFLYGPRGTKEKMKGLFDIFNFYLNYKIEIKEVDSGKFYEGKNFSLEAEKMEHGIPCLAYSFVVPKNVRIDKEKLKKSGLPPGPILQKIKGGEDVNYNGKKFRAKNLLYEEEGKKISVVLDTKTNERIAPFVKDADIFVSEATYSGELEKEATEHLHMTVSQVATIAKKAKVEKLILTHVSSRYSKDMKGVLDEARGIFKESYLVKDLEEIKV